jgi:glycosyltransferase involved in cell wall biosynthesis
MRLLILNYEYPPLGGGAGVCSQFHAEGLAKKGHQVKVITTWFDGEEEYEKKENLEIIRLKARRKNKFRSNPLEMLSWVIHSIRYINYQNLYNETDLVLAHFAIPGGLVALHFYAWNRMPYLIISHGQDIPWFCPRELFFYHLLFYLPIKIICRSSKYLTVLSDMRFQDAKKIMGNKYTSKIRIIPNGCNTDFFKPAYENKDKSIFRLIFSGRLTKQKDPFTMLKAVSYLHQCSVPFHLNIIGDGPLRKKMEEYVTSKGMAKRVNFTGWISKTELLGAYQQSNVMILSSNDEGMSLGLLEAFSCRLYVMTTPVSAHDIYLVSGINGELFPFGDHVQLGSKLEDYYRTKFLNNYEIPEQVLEQSRSKMSWDKVVEAYHQLISQ